jgi:hypothetical protein
VPEKTKLKLNLFHIRKRQKPQAIETHYVLHRKPSGGIVARVVIEEDMALKSGDQLIFDFSSEKV